ncbi:hypothetical protein [Paenibacillus sp. GCM10027626]|uniref:hypothetical protein n=1 Tax=Paenibacillus sp. GCM10027626 TaxID=3273411 RepID=UPI0036318600
MKQLAEADAAGLHDLHMYDFDLEPGETDSFLALAEMYMGKLTEGIPEHERKLGKPLSMRQRYEI